MSHLWLPSGAFEPRRYRPGGIGNWSGHLPFARDLVAATRPSLLVELGTHFGESYFGFCQAIAENGIPAAAYAVDTWAGEPHSGFYGEEIYNAVAAYNEANYAGFSYLIRSLFDDAIARFADNSIDLLHIDGLHTYEAVAHDFRSWLPKVKPGGVVLLHDVAARHADFGVWKLWKELEDNGSTFSFDHSWGLGVFEKPGNSERHNPFLRDLFDPEQKPLHQHLRRYYFLSALELEAKLDVAAHPFNNKGVGFEVQVYLPSPAGYSESQSHSATVVPGQWRQVDFDLFAGFPGGSLRIDPVDCPAFIEVRGIAIRSSFDGKMLWSAGGRDIQSWNTGGTILPLHDEPDSETARFFSYGPDPQLYLPELDRGLCDQPLKLEVWLRVEMGLQAIAPLLNKKEAPAAPPPELPVPEVSETESAEVQLLKAQLDVLHAQSAADGQKWNERVLDLESQLKEYSLRLNTEHILLEQRKQTAESDLMVALAELKSLQVEKENLLRDINSKQTKLYLLSDSHQAMKRLKGDHTELESKHQQLNENYSELESAYAALAEQYRGLRLTFDHVVQSHSWRITSPMRSLIRLVKGRS